TVHGALVPIHCHQLRAGEEQKRDFVCCGRRHPANSGWKRALHEVVFPGRAARGRLRDGNEPGRCRRRGATEIATAAHRNRDGLRRCALFPGCLSLAFPRAQQAPSSAAVFVGSKNEDIVPKQCLNQKSYSPYTSANMCLRTTSNIHLYLCSGERPTILFGSIIVYHNRPA